MKNIVFVISAMLTVSNIRADNIVYYNKVTKRIMKEDEVFRMTTTEFQTVAIKIDLTQTFAKLGRCDCISNNEWSRGGEVKAFCYNNLDDLNRLKANYGDDFSNKYCSNECFLKKIEQIDGHFALFDETPTVKSKEYFLYKINHINCKGFSVLCKDVYKYLKCLLTYPTFKLDFARTVDPFSLKSIEKVFGAYPRPERCPKCGGWVYDKNGENGVLYVEDLQSLELQVDLHTIECSNECFLRRLGFMSKNSLDFVHPLAVKAIHLAYYTKTWFGGSCEKVLSFLRRLATNEGEIPLSVSDASVYYGTATQVPSGLYDGPFGYKIFCVDAYENFATFSRTIEFNTYLCSIRCFLRNNKLMNKENLPDISLYNKDLTPILQRKYKECGGVIYAGSCIEVLENFNCFFRPTLKFYGELNDVVPIEEFNTFYRVENFRLSAVEGWNDGPQNKPIYCIIDMPISVPKLFETLDMKKTVCTSYYLFKNAGLLNEQGQIILKKLYPLLEKKKGKNIYAGSYEDVYETMKSFSKKKMLAAIELMKQERAIQSKP